MSTAIRWFWFASPQTFLPLAGAIARWCALGAALLAAAGLYVGFFVAPTDAQQGEVYRIIFIHVPAAWMSMFLYLVMALWAAVGLAFNTRLSHMMARAIAPTDAQQHDAYRIIFIHVPAAWMSMFIYVVMAFWCAVGFAMNTRLSFMMAQAPKTWLL